MLKTLLITLAIAWSHGEDKLGPNGGHIRMPGAFHTELVLMPHGAKIYLLDIQFKNPTTKNSEVELEHSTKTASEKTKCSAAGDYFGCSFSHKANLQTGELKVQATRSGQKGNLATYPLPLKLIPPAKK